MGKKSRSRDYRQAEEQGRASPTCDPRMLLRDLLERQGKWKRPGPPTRAWLVQWLLQRSVERMLGRPGPALLFLRVTSLIGEKGKTAGRAWISSRTLRAMAGSNRKTFETHRRALTAPWEIAGEWFPPLFRINLIGRGLKRRVEWLPLETGWIGFLELLDEASRAVKEEARAGSRIRGQTA